MASDKLIHVLRHKNIKSILEQSRRELFHVTPFPFKIIYIWLLGFSSSDNGRQDRSNSYGPREKAQREGGIRRNVICS